MALSSLPDPSTLANPFAGLPSAAGNNSLGNASSLLGGKPAPQANAQGAAFTQNLLDRNGFGNLPTSLQGNAVTFQDNFRGQITQPNNFTNPLASLVTNSQDSIITSNQLALGNLPTENPLGKINLDSLTGQLNGSLGSGLNAFTSGSNPFGALPSAPGANSLSGGAALLGGAPTALGGLNNTISSNVTGGISSLQSIAGSTSKLTADVTGALSKLTGGGLASGISNFAGSVAKSAGIVGNLLSLVRGANLPAGGQLFQQTGSPINLQPGAKDDWRVRITCQWNIFNSPLFKLLESTGGVVWPYLPTVNVSTSANYSQIDPVHSNQPYYAYKNSQVNEITISGEFSAETERDAAYWIAATTFFRTATKMFFGQGEYAGNPPPVCNLTGYGASVFDKVPVIIKTFNVNLNNDVNYVRCNTFGTTTWVPVVSTIDVTVVPVYSRERLRKFNLQDFAKGKTADPDGIGYL